MKRSLLLAALMALAASQSFAFVQTGQLAQPKRQPALSDPPSSYQQGSLVIGANAPTGGTAGLGINEPAGPADEQPTHPVPEPGMMALASMGLLALGVAGRKRGAARGR
ncbi:MAG: PEP-CTERM sorting domain-containing protein [Candidatus Eisenbacteria bacterium]|nr:PEP-CTERM sorting domain-containing protein [Candidatus Eisenbacteria bacterium]